MPHRLVHTLTYQDGLFRRHESTSRFPAAEAQRSRVARLRESGIPFKSGPGWVEYREEPPRHVEPVTVRLEWVDLSEVGA